MPNYTARMEYLQSIYHRYHKASKEDKGRILDEFCNVCHYHRKHALRLLHRPEHDPRDRGGCGLVRLVRDPVPRPP